MHPDRDWTDEQEQPTRFWQKIGLIADISSLCRQPEPDGSTLSRVLELIREIIPFDAATLYLNDPERGVLIPHACLGEAVAPPGSPARHSDHRLFSQQAKNREPALLLQDSVADDSCSEGKPTAVMSVPLVVEDDVIGVLVLRAFSRGVLKRKHLKLMGIVADQLAVSIERLNYMRMIEAKNAALQKAHEELKAIQKQIIAAEKLTALVELAASINHEINNPLSVIVGHVQLLQAKATSSCSEAQDRLQRVERAAMQIAEINRKLLRIDSIVSEKYLDDRDSKMLNLEKSTLS